MSRRKLKAPVPEDPDDPWRTIFTDVDEWFTGDRATVVLTAISLVSISLATYFSVGQIMRSTYVCFSLIESRQTVFLLQCLGLVLDAFIATMLWRLLAWSRSTKLQLRTIGSVLVLSSLSMGLLWVGSRLFTGSTSLHSGAGFGFLYGIDIIVDSLAFATLLVSTALWICETNPIIPVSITTSLVGIWTASDNIFHLGDWLHLSRAAALFPLWFVAVGLILFIYAQEIHRIIFLRRIVIAFLLVVLIFGTTIYACTRPLAEFKARHPINDLVYHAHAKHDSWLSQAYTSKSLPVAIRIYKERHDGRNPPPKFSEWYDLAKNTLVIDDFAQMDRDLESFRKLSPENLRKRAVVMAAHPSAQSITIKNGEVTHSSDGKHKELEELAEIIKKFSKHLPDMVLPINLSPGPQILPTWEEADRQSHADLSAFMNLISKRGIDAANGTLGEQKESRDESTTPENPIWTFTSASEYRQMQVQGCSPTSRARRRPHWDMGEFCATCVRRHSKGQLLTRFDRSLDFCKQPDLQYLHGFTLTNPRSPPVRELMPLFSASKTDAFKDILIPLPRHIKEEADESLSFDKRYDTLFWRSDIGDHAISDQALRGNHKYRLLHLINNPSPEDEVTMILLASGSEEKVARYQYEEVSALEVSQVLPFSVGVGNYSSCLGANCELLKEAYGARDEPQEPLAYRYVLALDDDDGPSPQALRTLRSQSVPFVSTIFRTWYTERLTPWLHFVPIDPRYHALHTIFAYFTGTEDRGKINGHDTKMSGRPQDAEWIGQQGRKWAERALGEKDVEVYLFRLLLEWGRLVDDQRDSLGFWQDDQGQLHDDDWTRDQKGNP